MSNIQEDWTGNAHSGEEKGEERKAQNLRFTPLRSYVSRARVLAREPRGEPVLSRLIPAQRLQS